MPFVSIKYVAENLAEDRTGKMHRIAERVSQAIADEMGVATEAVWIGFEAIPADAFHVGADSVADIRARKK
jgi:phenylpyruvate tautomerase PptA (4-oxalocrotonate tautomerase family)